MARVACENYSMGEMHMFKKTTDKLEQPIANNQPNSEHSITERIQINTNTENKSVANNSGPTYIRSNKKSRHTHYITTKVFSKFSSCNSEYFSDWAFVHLKEELCQSRLQALIAFVLECYARGFRGTLTASFCREILIQVLGEPEKSFTKESLNTKTKRDSDKKYFGALSTIYETYKLFKNSKQGYEIAENIESILQNLNEKYIEINFYRNTSLGTYNSKVEIKPKEMFAKINAYIKNQKSKNEQQSQTEGENANNNNNDANKREYGEENNTNQTSKRIKSTSVEAQPIRLNVFSKSTEDYKMTENDAEAVSILTVMQELKSDQDKLDITRSESNHTEKEATTFTNNITFFGQPGSSATESKKIPAGSNPAPISRIN